MNTSWSGDRTGFPKSTRSLILRRDPVCMICGERPSEIADHEPNHATLIRQGVNNPHDIRYGQGVCEPCHTAKTKAEQQAGRDLKRRPARLHPGRTTR